jgi:hypothetical protein
MRPDLEDRMERRSSRLRAYLPCPRCGRSLVPVPTASSVTFHCKSGHQLDATEALQQGSSALKVGVEALLNEWDRQHGVLLAIVDDATRRGHVDVAQIFGRQARALEARIEVLKSAFWKTDSSKLLPIPPSIRRN